jgi:hypothetical protein
MSFADNSDYFRTKTGDDSGLMEAILKEKNLRLALQRVRANKGAPGVGVSENSRTVMHAAP